VRKLARIGYGMIARSKRREARQQTRKKENEESKRRSRGIKEVDQVLSGRLTFWTDLIILKRFPINLSFSYPCTNISLVFVFDEGATICQPD
jgi:hypothetical protein